MKQRMYCQRVTPNASWLTAYNPPSSVHGSCVGVSEANKLIAQKCAMMAIKHPFEITDCSNI
jgi:hypothetical protein